MCTLMVARHVFSGLTLAPAQQVLCREEPDRLRARRLLRVTPAAIQVLLQSCAARLSPQTLNRLRRFIRTAFNHAKRAGRFVGPNPAAEVARRKVAKRLPDFLHAEEVPRVLNALSDRWRPPCVSAIFTGMRHGELLGLCKRDVDLFAGLINTSHSHA